MRRFQTTASIPLFLLTSQVGGLGLTLTAADRVIVVDPSWNPATDNQAVDRCAARVQYLGKVVSFALAVCIIPHRCACKSYLRSEGKIQTTVMCAEHTGLARRGM